MHTSIVRVNYLRQIAAAALDLGVDVKSLLSEFGLLEGNLVDPTVEIPIEKFGAFITAAIACSVATGLGVLAGRRMPPSSHGLVGLAAMTSRNIREAMQIIERFVGLRTGVIDIHTRVVDGMLEVYFAPAPGLGAASNPVTEISVVTIKYVADDLFPDVSACARASFDFPEPPHSKLARDIFGCEVLYGQAWCGLSFALPLAEELSSKHDPLVQAEAVRICAEELKKLRSNVSTRAKLEDLITGQSPLFPTLDTCAGLLGTTPRTLHRRLVTEGTSYREVAESVRHRLALDLLQKKISVKQVAYLLNYTDVANFRRAFKRWEGVAPSDWLGKNLNS